MPAWCVSVWQNGGSVSLGLYSKEGRHGLPPPIVRAFGRVAANVGGTRGRERLYAGGAASIGCREDRDVNAKVPTGWPQGRAVRQEIRARADAAAVRKPRGNTALVGRCVC